MQHCQIKSFGGTCVIYPLVHGVLSWAEHHLLSPAATLTALQSDMGIAVR